MAFFVFFATFFCLLFRGFDAVDRKQRDGTSYSGITIEYNEMVNPLVVYLDDDNIKLVCKYFTSSPNAAPLGDAEWVKVEGQQIVKLSSTGPDFVDSSHSSISLTVGSVGTYSCRYISQPGLERRVTVNSVTSVPTTQSTTTVSPPTHSHPETTASDGSTSATGTDETTPTNFKALNPVIYTVVSAAILGTLTIVAIVTCWLRSRKNVHLQTLLPRNSPQDYLDFIQENEFTPMTTSEFLASLQERPPTYNESENIERQKRESNGEGEGEGGGGQEQPPPLPPRNNPQRSGTRPPGSSASTRPASSQSQLSSSSGGHSTSSSLSLTAPRQPGRSSSDAQGGPGGLSADLHMDAVIAAFVESIEILEAERAAMSSPRNRANEEDESSGLDSSETSALLGGVAPSLDAVV